MQHDVTLLRTAHLLVPNEARNLAFERVDTEFVAFVDNDVFLSEGWLPTLEAAADRHGAAVGGRARLRDRPGRSVGGPHPRRRQAGDPIVVEDGRRRYRLDPHDEDADPADVLPRLAPRPTEQAEFHCFFARTETIRAIAPFDEGLGSAERAPRRDPAHPRAGGTIWLEPSVFVTYFVPSRMPWSDLPYVLLRWSRAWNEASIDRFHASWDLDADDPARRSSSARPTTSATGPTGRTGR